MMEDISLTDPEDIPRPPDQVEIIDFQAQPYEDGKRVLISLTFTPFQENPSADVLVFDQEGSQVAKANIIETFDPDTEITIHLRQKEPQGQYRVSAQAYYLKHDHPEEESEEVKKPEKRMIGNAETTFVIPK